MPKCFLIDYDLRDAKDLADKQPNWTRLAELTYLNSHGDEVILINNPNSLRGTRHCGIYLGAGFYSRPDYYDFQVMTLNRECRKLNLVVNDMR